VKKAAGMMQGEEEEGDESIRESVYEIR